MAEAEPLLEARNPVKHYGQVLALDGANFTAYPGEVVALIGDKGAGKSTLVKALSGAIRPDGGDILVEGGGAADGLGRAGCPSSSAAACCCRPGQTR